MRSLNSPWYRVARHIVKQWDLAWRYLGIALQPTSAPFSPKARIVDAWSSSKFLAFPIYGTAVWPTFVLAQEERISRFRLLPVLTGLVLIAFAAWLYEGLRHSGNRWRRRGLAASALPLIGAVALVPLAGTNQTLHVAATENNVGISWLPFSTNKVDELQAQGRSIFVDFTADWCITCKINERVTLESPAIIEAFAANEVAALRADWTRQDASITRMLEANGRAGVPLYLFYPEARSAGRDVAGRSSCRNF